MADVNLLELDQQLGNVLGIGEFAGGILATLIMMSLFLIPTLFFCKKFDMSAMILSIVVGFTSLSFGVAVQWLSYWVLLIPVLIAALMFAGSMRDWITGQGRG